MKKVLLLLLSLIATNVWADKNWNEHTQDVAYEAPNSKMVGKWYQDGDANKTCLQINANGTLALYMEGKISDVACRFDAKIPGTWKRDKQDLKITFNWNLSTTTANKEDLAKLSARNRDAAIKFVQNKQAEGRKKGVQSENNIILRLDDGYFIYSRANGKYFNDVSPTELRSQKYMDYKDQENKAFNEYVDSQNQDCILLQFWAGDNGKVKITSDYEKLKSVCKKMWISGKEVPISETIDQYPYYSTYVALQIEGDSLKGGMFNDLSQLKGLWLPKNIRSIENEFNNCQWLHWIISYPNQAPIIKYSFFNVGIELRDKTMKYLKSSSDYEGYKVFADFIRGKGFKVETLNL